MRQLLELVTDLSPIVKGAWLIWGIWALVQIAWYRRSRVAAPDRPPVRATAAVHSPAVQPATATAAVQMTARTIEKEASAAIAPAHAADEGRRSRKHRARRRRHTGEPIAVDA